MIKGFIGTSLIDYPSKVSAIVFTGGCNYACPFCHNAPLVLPSLLSSQPDIPLEELLDKLRERSRFIDGVVISGGEPTIHGDTLIELIREIKKLATGSKTLGIKLDTNGSHPELLTKLIQEGLIDYIAMDIKATPERYDEVCGVVNSFVQIQQSIRLIIDSGLDHEFRTTAVPSLIDTASLIRIAELVEGCRQYTLQEYCPEKTLNPSFGEISPFPPSFWKEAEKKLQERFSFRFSQRR